MLFYPRSRNNPINLVISTEERNWMNIHVILIQYVRTAFRYSCMENQMIWHVWKNMKLQYKPLRARETCALAVVWAIWKQHWYVLPLLWLKIYPDMWGIYALLIHFGRGAIWYSSIFGIFVAYLKQLWKIRQSASESQ